jgi:hypothetical protein
LDLKQEIQNQICVSFSRTLDCQLWAHNTNISTPNVFRDVLAKSH